MIRDERRLSRLGRLHHGCGARLDLADRREREVVLKYHTEARKFWNDLLERANAK